MLEVIKSAIYKDMSYGVLKKEELRGSSGNGGSKYVRKAMYSEEYR
jgi:hypothetical protein